MNMISSGYTSDSAIDKIYTTHGQAMAVSTILLKLGNDRRREGHPDLRA